MFAKYAKAWVAAIALPTITILIAGFRETTGIDLGGSQEMIIGLIGTFAATWAIPNA